MKTKIVMKHYGLHVWGRYFLLYKDQWHCITAAQWSNAREAAHKYRDFLEEKDREWQSK